MAKLAICVECGCNVRSDRLALHLQRVHGRIERPVMRNGAAEGTKGDVATKPALVRAALKQGGGREVLKKGARRQGKISGRKTRTSGAANIQRVLARHAKDPRRCASPDCANKVVPPQEVCDPCKTKAMSQGSGLRPASVSGSSCRSCGARAMDGENYCYYCI